VSALNDYRAVLACAVAAREDSRGDKYLIGYVVLDGESQPTAAALQEFLRQRLPDYMVPAVFVKLESLPLMPSGKVDREALPLPSDSNILRDEQFLQVRTLVEKRVAGILAELLSLQQVGVDDDFFLLGGHSLLATQVVAQIDDAFGIELTLRDVFEAPTVAELSDKIERLLLAKVQLISEDDAQRILGDR
jgi:acyl carrier protein